ncbi:MAG TPA: glycosyltransferase family 9 protein [Opitutaceae bacterium]|nr:glycosyltransferase family 9 protein [Opitutaceae bacterium]
MQKILVLRGGALGDFIVTLPVFTALRRRWPAASIEMVGNVTAGRIAEERGLITKVHSQHEPRWGILYADQPLSGTFAQWLGSFDLVVSYWPDPERELARRFPVRDGQRFVSAPPLPRRGPAAAHYCDALRPLGIGADAYFCQINEDDIVPRADGPAGLIRHSLRAGNRPAIRGPLPGDQVQRPAGAPLNHGCRIALHPGSGSPRKNWPNDRWIELIGQLDSVLLVLGEAEAKNWDRDLIGKMTAQAGADGRSFCVAINRPLEELMTVLRTCGMFVGHDSGVSHLAAALGIPSVLLFGPTSPAIWAPPARHVQVLQFSTSLESIHVNDVIALLSQVDLRR